MQLMSNTVKKELELMQKVLNDKNTYDANKLEVIQSILDRLLYE